MNYKIILGFMAILLISGIALGVSGDFDLQAPTDYNIRLITVSSGTEIKFLINNSDALNINNISLYPLTDDFISLGNSTNRFDDAFFDNLTLTDFVSCTALETDGSGNVVCGTDDAGAGGIGKSGDPPYLYNDTTTIYFNETYLNLTIDYRENDTTYSHLTNFTDQSIGTVLRVDSFTSPAQLVLTEEALEQGSDNQFDISDSYKIWNVVECTLGGGNFTALDSLGVSMSAAMPTWGVMINTSKSASPTISISGCLPSKE